MLDYGMFETKDQRDARMKAEAKFREVVVRRYEEVMGVELPYSPVAVVERVPVTAREKPASAPESPKPGKVAKFDRNAYQRDLMRKRRAAAKSNSTVA